jgi:tripartite-type tricarboxylate transporter receptor subunit TctC
MGDREFIAKLLPAIAMLVGAGMVAAQNYPGKPIRIITSGIGGSADFVSRLIAQGISGPLEQQVIVENRASGVTQEVVSKAPPDGYTLLFTSSSHWLLPLMRSVPYDPVKDFSAITVISVLPNILVAHPSLPVRNVKELIALGKAKAGTLNYGTTGTGTPNHLAAELFKAMSGVDMVRINYKSTAGALTDLISGQLHISFHTAGSVSPHIKSGRLKALAVTGAQPSIAYPDLPTVTSSGLPGYESMATQAMFAPAKTPAAIISVLNREIVRYLNQPEARSKILGAGVEVVGSSPEQLDTAMKAEIARMGKVIKDAGIRDE